MKNRIFSLLMAMLLAVNLAVSAEAREQPEEKTGECSIEVTLRYHGLPIKDGKLTAVRVGYMDQEDNNYFFRQIGNHEIIPNIGSRETVVAMSDFYESQKNNYDFFEKTLAIENGTVRFMQLDTGLYLIVQKQENASSGFYPVNEFLVSVPYWDGTGYRYHVDASVKTEPDDMLPKPTENEDVPPSGVTSDPKLPQTGQLSWPVPVMAVCGMLLFAIGWWLYFGDRKEPYEK